MVQKIEVSSKTIVFTVIFLLSLKILFVVRELIYALFLAFIFMSALKPAVNSLERQKIPRIFATLIVFVSTLLAIFFMLGFIFPPLIIESVAFIKNLPLLLENTLPIVSDYLQQDSLASFLPDITQNIFRVVGGVFSNLIFVVSILFFTFYFLLEEKFLGTFLDRFLEDKKSQEIISVISKAERRMGAWVWGEVVLMTVIGIVTYIGLSILQIRYALPLAVLAGALEVVPIIGPTISAIPALFVGLSISPLTGLSIVALYFIIQQLENNLIVPFVMKRTVGLHPIITLVALTIGGKLGGFLGILLSVPAALFIETLLIELTRTKR